MKIMQEQVRTTHIWSFFVRYLFHRLKFNYLLYACIWYSYLLYWYLVCFNRCFKADCMQGRRIFGEGEHIFRLFGACPISMLSFLLYALILEQTFVRCMSDVLQPMVLTYFRAGMIPIVWLPSCFQKKSSSAPKHSIQATISNLNFFLIVICILPL